VLQRIHELQEQTAVAGHAFAFLDAGFELNAAVTRFAECDLATREFRRSGLNVNERLVFVSRRMAFIGTVSTFCTAAARTVAVTYISFFNFFLGFCVTMRACRVRVVASRAGAM